MQKTIQWEGDEMHVSHSGVDDALGNPTGAVWTIQPAQVGRHRAMFDADMTAAQRAKSDAVAAKFAPAAEVEASK